MIQSSHNMIQDSSDKKIKFAFFGSDEFSIIVLEELLKEGYVPALCVTQPDKPQGRKLVLTPTPLKNFCIQKNIPVETPEILNPEIFDTPESVELTESADPFDFFIIASYGKIISQKIIDIPLRGCLNVHPSLLPTYRGASPIETAILENQKETGVTIMLMDAKMDHGPLLAQQFHTFPEWPTSKTDVHDTLAHLGGRLLTQTIPDFLNGKIIPQEQNHSDATFTKMIKKEDGRISITDTDYKTYLKYIALTPWPGLFFFIENAKSKKQIRVKIESAHFDFETDPAKGFMIDTVIPEGKKSMSFKSFKNGYLS